MAGCSKYYTVSGSVTFPKNVQPKETEPVQISFVPEAQGQKPGFVVFSRSDNTFVCKDVSPGKYKIAVNITTGPAAKGADTKHAAEVAKFNKTFGPKDTKLTYDVTTDSDQSIDLDLTKGTVTKK